MLYGLCVLTIECRMEMTVDTSTTGTLIMVDIVGPRTTPHPRKWPMSQPSGTRQEERKEENMSVYQPYRIHL